MRSITFLLYSLVVATPIAMAAPSDNLYNTWQANRQSKHDVAYEAAKSYLEKYSKEARAESVRAWVAAYEKILNQSKATQSPANSEDASASLEQTLEWIKEKVTNYGEESVRDTGEGAFRNKDTKQSMTYSQCSVELKWSRELGHPGERGSQRVGQGYTVPLQEMDPSTIEIKQVREGDKVEGGTRWETTFRNSFFEVVTKAPGNKEPIKRLGLSNTAAPQMYSDRSFVIRLTDGDTASRMSKALSHAINLCRKQNEAGGATTKKELF